MTILTDCLAALAQQNAEGQEGEPGGLDTVFLYHYCTTIRTVYPIPGFFSQVSFGSWARLFPPSRMDISSSFSLCTPCPPRRTRVFWMTMWFCYLVNFVAVLEFLSSR